MKPYKVGTQWVDLDMVIAIDDYIGARLNSSEVVGTIVCAFLNNPYEISLGCVDRDRGIAPLDAEWEAFKTAWKTKDTMFGASK